MALHLLKLCVGADSVEDLEAWIANRLAAAESSGAKREQFHVTRMTPKRAVELVDGGSLYWVVKGNVQVRQRLLEVRPFTDGEGISRCRLVLEPILHRTHWQPRRAFQGWRYLETKDAPSDLSSDDAELAALPPELRLQLADLGLL